MSNRSEAARKAAETKRRKRWELFKFELRRQERAEKIAERAYERAAIRAEREAERRKRLAERQAELEKAAREERAYEERRKIISGAGSAVTKVRKTGGAQVGVNFFLLGLGILVGIPDMLPAFYRTVFEPEGELTDEEKLARLDEAKENIQTWLTRTYKLIGQLFIVAVGVAAVASADEDAGKALAGVILFLMIMRDWDKIMRQLQAQGTPEEKPKHAPGAGPQPAPPPIQRYKSPGRWGIPPPVTPPRPPGPPGSRTFA